MNPAAQGLSQAEAGRLLQEHGPNALPAPPRRGLGRIARGVLTEPMFLLLALAAVSYLMLGDLAEGLLLGFFAALTIGLVVLQERRGERAIEALRALGAPRAHVVREGRTQRIASAEVVPGDLLVVEEGERIAADGVLVSCRQLQVDESLLTGESVPVSKRIASEEESRAASADPGGDGQPWVFGGTLATSGEGLVRVLATGPRSRCGLIGRSLAVIDTEPTRLQKNTGRLVRLFGGFAALISLLLLLFHGLVLGQWIDGLLSAIALAMALLPEEFPLALAVFFAIGAWRLARAKVLARRAAVIEMLGAATVLCVDKTGTLTENRMRIRQLDVGTDPLHVEEGAGPLPGDFHRLVEYALLAARRQSFDPMDRAVGDLAMQALRGTGRLHDDWLLGRQYGLSPGLPAMSQAWRSAEGLHEIATKGAPEAVARLCRLPPDQYRDWMQRVTAMAAKGLRVLAVAAGRHAGPALPDRVEGFAFEWLGLVGFEDPLRQTVPTALAQARKAGIDVRMITGDYPATALAIAREAGFPADAVALAGDRLAAMDDEELDRALGSIHVFARVQPEQKLRLVQALKRRGEVVAMTGDGVNDAPALKAAHIGIAMGQRGSDVAREASDMVLLDEDFGRILDAVALGRRVFDNLRKVMLYIVAIHIPIAGLALLPLLIGMPPLLLPAHVVLIEMIIDPMCSVAFENEPAEPDAMRQPPRPLDEPLIGPGQLLLGVAQGSALLLACLALYGHSLAIGLGTDAARTLAFLSLTAGNIMLVLTHASRGPAWRRLFRRGRIAFWMIALAASATVALCIGWPWLAGLFGFAWPGTGHAALAIATGLAAGAALEAFKARPRIRRILGHQPG